MNFDLTATNIQTLSAIVMPIIVTLFGWHISRRINKSQLVADKETQWRQYWATELLATVSDFLDASTSIVMTLSHLEKDLTADQLAKFHEQINNDVQKLSRSEWELRNITQLSGQSGKPILEAGSNIFQLVQQLLKDRQGDLEAIRTAQQNLLAQSKNAHADLLELE